MMKNQAWIMGPALAATLWSGMALSGSATYEITITNVTRAQHFTPTLAAAHKDGVHLFQLGAPASIEMATLAEAGDTAPMAALLATMPEVGATAATAGLLAPGASVTLQITAGTEFNYLSLAAMLVPTNDGFIALDSVPLPRGKAQTVWASPVFDSGSEPNDELCANIPGPDCGGIGGSPEAGGEGYVHVHAGIHGIGDLSAAEYDWRNPAAHIVIRKVTQ